MKRFSGIKYITAGFLFMAMCFAMCKKNTNTTASYAPPQGGSTTTTGGIDTNHSFPVTQVYVFNYHFSPSDVAIAEGSSISWTNRDSIAHTVTSRDGSFESGDLGPGKNFFVTFPKAGYTSYYCRYHKEGGNITIH